MHYGLYTWNIQSRMFHFGVKVKLWTLECRSQWCILNSMCRSQRDRRQCVYLQWTNEQGPGLKHKQVHRIISPQGNALALSNPLRHNQDSCIAKKHRWGEDKNQIIPKNTHKGANNNWRIFLYLKQQTANQTITNRWVHYLWKQTKEMGTEAGSSSATEGVVNSQMQTGVRKESTRVTFFSYKFVYI